MNDRRKSTKTKGRNDTPAPGGGELLKTFGSASELRAMLKENATYCNLPVGSTARFLVPTQGLLQLIKRYASVRKLTIDAQNPEVISSLVTLYFNSAIHDSDVTFSCDYVSDDFSCVIMRRVSTKDSLSLLARLSGVLATSRLRGDLTQLLNRLLDAENDAALRTKLTACLAALEPPATRHKTSTELPATVPPLPKKGEVPEYAKRHNHPELADLDIIDFLRKVWGPWIKPKSPSEMMALRDQALTRAYLSKVDKSADGAIKNLLNKSKRHLPSDVFIPTAEELNTVIVTDPELRLWIMRLHSALRRRPAAKPAI